MALITEMKTLSAIMKVRGCGYFADEARSSVRCQDTEGSCDCRRMTEEVLAALGIPLIALSVEQLDRPKFDDISEALSLVPDSYRLAAIDHENDVHELAGNVGDFTRILFLLGAWQSTAIALEAENAELRKAKRLLEIQTEGKS